MAEVGAPTGTLARLRSAPRLVMSVLRGRTDVDRLLHVHPVHSAAETFFAVSLAGSLFFNVSVDAARPRILLYLAVTMMPFLVLAPLIGPLIDRVRGGPRLVISATLVGRAVLALLLAQQLKTLLLFPLAFGILVLGRTYSVARISLTPSLVKDPTQLVSVNAQVALIGTIGGMLGSVVAVAILGTAGAPWVLRAATGVYLIAAGLALRLPLATRPPEEMPVEEYIELHDPVIQSTAMDMATLRAAVGFLTFHLGFALKQAGAPTWFFGAVVAANALGGLSGNLLAPVLRRRMREQAMLAVALVSPALLAYVAGVRYHEITVVALVAVLGVSATVARRAYDGVVQVRAPHARRGRAHAWLETRLEVAWVAGSLAAVSARTAGWLGVFATAVALSVMALLHIRRTRSWVALREIRRTDPLAQRVLRTAEQLAAQGDEEQAVVMAVLAAEVALGVGVQDPSPSPHLDELRSMRAGLLEGTRPSGPQALDLARQLVATEPGPAPSA